MSMTSHQRLSAVLNGQPPDRLPWAPRLEIWYTAHLRRGTLPDEYRGWALREIYKDLGMCVQARDLLRRRIFRTELRGVEIDVNQDGYDTRRTYHTPAGKLTTLHRTSAELQRDGIEALEVEHMIKSAEDYRPAAYLIAHTELTPTYDEYLAYEREVGEDGLVITYIGQDPFSWLIQDLIGYQQAYYHLADHPREVAYLLEALTEHCLERQRLALASPARLIMHGQHFDTQITPPRLFRQYMLPYYQPFAEQMGASFGAHAHGKVLACHADADTHKILDLIKEAGFKLLDCFVTAPMVTMTIEKARQILGADVIIWGGMPSTLLDEALVSQDDFEVYLERLFTAVAPGNAFILGVADNVMPDSSLARLRQISRLVETNGEYPIQ